MDAKRAVETLTPERWSLLKQLFERALALDGSERSEFVVAACCDDVALASALASLLHYHEGTSSLLDGPAIPFERFVELAAIECRTFNAGDVVADRFRIIRFVAEGGMGEVYAAEDLELNEPVALKTISPALGTDETVLARFKQEIQLARRVTHRNVSRMFDLFRHHSPHRQHPIVFLSMELLEGETLSERIRRVGRIPLADAHSIATQLIAGLGAAHAAGIIHRDFKSSNIVLVPELLDDAPSGERVVVADFGLAGTLKREPASEPTAVAGTPAYMAPEQVEDGLVTAAADIYALGIVLFEMIAGHVPFRGQSAIATAELRLHREAPTLKSQIPTVSGDWDRTVRACLQRDVRKRPSSAAEVADLLTGRARRRRNRHIMLASTCAVLLFAGIWRWAHMPYRPNAAAQAAVDSGRVKRGNVTKDGFAGSIGDFRRAIELDPNWAQGWAELAYTYAAGANTQEIPAATASAEARAAALQAISRERRSAKAFGALGWVQSLDFDDWPAAEENLRRALALDPSDAQVHYWLGVHL